MKKTNLRDRKRFTIGDVVLVRATVERASEDGCRTIERQELDPAKVGRVVGIRRIFEGSLCGGGCGGFNHEPASLRPTSSEEVWLVRFGMKNREHMVRDEDLFGRSVIIRGEETFGTPFPVVDGKWFRYKWSEQDKEEFRRVAQRIPRDSKGRWMKEEVTSESDSR